MNAQETNQSETSKSTEDTSTSFPLPRNRGDTAGVGQSGTGRYIDAVKLIKSGQDEEFFKSKAKEFFNLSNPEEVAAGIKVNKENFADKWSDGLFQSQNNILHSGVGLGLLPNIGDLNSIWIK